jgi:3-hydroxybutyryl-CoA dehydrogenase
MNVTVLGVDSLGRKLARLCVQGGNAVSIHADDPAAAMDAIDAIERRLGDGTLRGTALDATTDLSTAVSNADLVVITDTREPARRFAVVEDVVDQQTVLATSQPSLSVAAVAETLTHPERVVGLRLDRGDTGVVEVVVTEETVPATLDRAGSFVEAVDATPQFVADTPGPLATRLAVTQEVEAMRLLAAGVAAVETLDSLLAAEPIGPLERADRAGLHRRLDTLEYLAREVGDRYEPPTLLADRVAAGKTGVDAGEGFYVWEQDEPARPAIEGPAFDRR